MTGYKAGDRVKVKASTEFYTGYTGTVIESSPPGYGWGWYRVMLDAGFSWNFDRDELELIEADNNGR